MGEDKGGSAEVRPFRWKELEEHRPDPPQNVSSGALPPEEATRVEPQAEAEALLDAARDEAEALLAAARQEAVEIRQTAHREGHEAGRAEGLGRLEQATDQWVTAASELAGHKPRLLEEARSQVVDLALSLVEKILGPLAEEDAEAVVRVTGRALAALSDREMVTVRVHPEDLQSLVEAKPRLLQTLDGVKKLTVVEDHSVARGGCLVETPTAEIDARLDTQLQEIVRTLKKIQ